MPTYNYRGRNRAGKEVKGSMDALTVDGAADALIANQVTPIDIKLEGGENDLGFEWLSALFRSNDISEIEHITFSRQMYNLTKAGIPLDRALRGLEGSITNNALKTILKDMLANLERGNNLSDTLRQHPKVFNDLYVNLVRVGESTGRLDLAFQDLARYMEIERNTSQQLKSAVRYPTFVLIAMGGALAVVTVFVIPAFSGVFAKLGDKIPWQTQALVNTSEFIINFWPLLLVLTGLGAIVFRLWTGTAAGGLTWDRIKLRMPVVGSVFERIALARFSKTFSIMSRAGVPIVTALSVVSDVVGNRFIASKVLGMGDGVSRGESLYLTAQRTEIFLPLVLQMISVGEESGNLPELLDEVSEFYDSEVEYDLSKLTTAIEPILIMFIAVLVLILALGVFLPIWDLAGGQY
ncbi:MAG: type II secretion system F family protein [Gammaproteobacteria bacterium]|jgi:MSHA biogenesis protein MshG|nr:type II secretion system F family protein [Gammaproteobacteria bacterium]MBT5604038.1 type II secretion system F family protein [Gammaproteobacteria bacterium]MBT6246333.1 type II secretion system F family protein [Gammaproteobacteria bacterium]